MCCYYFLNDIYIINRTNVLEDAIYIKYITQEGFKHVMMQGGIVGMIKKTAHLPLVFLPGVG